MRPMTWFRDAPIKRKLLLIGLLTSGIALLFFSLILTAMDIVEWRDRTVGDLTTYAKVIGTNAAPAMLFKDSNNATETLSALSANQNIVHAALYDREGKEFAIYIDPAHSPQPLPYPVTGDYLLTFDSMIISNPVYFKNELLGSITLESDLRGLYTGVLRRVGLIFLAAFGVFLLAAFLFARLQKAIVTPIMNIAEVMQDVIAKQNFAARVATHGKDEAGMLAGTFNTMLEYIQLRDAELAKHREHLEQEVAQRTARLTEAQRIAHLGDWEWDIANNTLNWSDEIYRIFGLTPQQFGANYEAFLQAVHPEDRQFVDTQVRAALEQSRTYSIDHRIVLPDGTVCYVHEQAEVLCNEEGQPVKMLGTVQDITERKEAEEDLRRSNTDLEQFAYAASHDMRQPLRMISSYLQLLESDLAPVLTDETRQNLQFATEGAKRMDQMLTALLDYSRVGRKTDAMAVIDSREVMDEALRYLKPAIGEAQADVRMDGVWPRLFASRDEILRLFQNLIDNALKYRLAGQKPEVIVSAQIVGGEWRLEVRDNGVGLLPGHETRLFKVFERLQPRSRYPGTGIGLALCRKIVEHHKGRIRAESPGENQGCTFIVTLPASLPASSGGALINVNKIKESA